MAHLRAARRTGPPRSRSLSGADTMKRPGAQTRRATRGECLMPKCASLTIQQGRDGHGCRDSRAESAAVCIDFRRRRAALVRRGGRDPGQWRAARDRAARGSRAPPPATRRNLCAPSLARAIPSFEISGHPGDDTAGRRTRTLDKTDGTGAHFGPGARGRRAIKQMINSLLTWRRGRAEREGDVREVDVERRTESEERSRERRGRGE